MISRKARFLFYIIFFTLSTAFSQNREIENLLHQLDTIQISGKAKLLNELSKAYWEISNEKSLESARQALEIAEQAKDTNEIACSYNRMGNAYSHIGNYQKSIEYYLKALKLQEKIQDRLAIANLHNNIGIIYLSIAENKKGLEYLQHSLEIGTPLNDTSFLADLNNNMGIAYSGLQDYEKAEAYHQKALTIYSQRKDSIGLAKTYNNLGIICRYQNRLNQAITFYDKSLNIKKHQNNWQGIGNTHYNIAVIYLLKDDLSNAYRHIKKMNEIGDSIKDLSLQNKSYLLLSVYYEEIKNISEAYENYKMYSFTQDSLNRRNKATEIANLETQYRIEAKDQEIELLKKDNQIQQLKNRKHKTQRNFTLLLVLFLGVFSLGIWIAYRMKKRGNQMLEIKNKQLAETNEKLIKSEKKQRELNATKDKLFSIIAHDLLNPFNAILGFSDYLERNYPRLDEDDRISSIQNIHLASKQAFNLLNNLLQWARTQSNRLTYQPQIVALGQIIRESLLLHDANIREKSQKIELEIDPNDQVWADPHQISLVIRNLLSNAIKFTHENGTIQITVISDPNGMAEISIQDNGVGINAEDQAKLFHIETNFTQPGTNFEKGTGLGLVLCKEFIEKNKGKIRIESELGKGSSFIFTLPLQEN